eukprot:158634_1
MRITTFLLFALLSLDNFIFSVSAKRNNRERKRKRRRRHKAGRGESNKVLGGNERTGEDEFIGLYFIGGSESYEVKILECTPTSLTIGGNSQYLSRIRGGT